MKDGYLIDGCGGIPPGYHRHVVHYRPEPAKPVDCRQHLIGSVAAQVVAHERDVAARQAVEQMSCRDVPTSVLDTLGGQRGVILGELGERDAQMRTVVVWATDGAVEDLVGLPCVKGVTRDAQAYLGEAAQVPR